MLARIPGARKTCTSQCAKALLAPYGERGLMRVASSCGVDVVPAKISALDVDEGHRLAGALLPLPEHLQQAGDEDAVDLAGEHRLLPRESHRGMARQVDHGVDVRRLEDGDELVAVAHLQLMERDRVAENLQGLGHLFTRSDGAVYGPRRRRAARPGIPRPVPLYR